MATSKRLTNFLHSEVFPFIDNHEVSENDLHAGTNSREKWRKEKMVWRFSPNLAINNNRLRVENICAGLHHTLFTCTNGTVFSFGNGKFGQLGHGDKQSLVKPKKIQHVENLLIKNFNEKERIGKICAGVTFSCLLLKVSGKVIIFGEGRQGELGQGERIRKAHKPTLLSSDKLPPLIDISAGAFHILAISRIDRKVYSWGRNVEGQLGLGETSKFQNIFSPTWVSKIRLPSNNDEVLTVAAGYYHSCALTDAGSVWLWGLNRQKQLGIQNEIQILPNPAKANRIKTKGPEFEEEKDDDERNERKTHSKNIPRHKQETQTNTKCPSPIVLDFGEHIHKFYVAISAGGWHTALLSDENELIVLGGIKQIRRYRPTTSVQRVISGGDKIALLLDNGNVVMSKELMCRPGTTVTGMLCLREPPAKLKLKNQKKRKTNHELSFSLLTSLVDSALEFDGDVDSIIETEKNLEVVTRKYVEALQERHLSKTRNYAVNIPITRHWVNANGKGFMYGFTDCEIDRHVSHLERVKEEKLYMNGWKESGENKMLSDYEAIETIERQNSFNDHLREALVELKRPKTYIQKLAHLVHQKKVTLKKKLQVVIRMRDSLFHVLNLPVRSNLLKRVDAEWKAEDIGNTISGDIIYDIEYECKLSRITNVVLEALRGFVEVDEDNSGELDQTELWLALQYYGHNVSLKKVAKFMEEADTDGNGTIDEAEFVDFAMAIHGKTLQNPIVAKFFHCINLKTKIPAMTRENEFRHFIAVFREECVKRRLFKSMPKLLKAKLIHSLRNAHVEKGKLDLRNCGITDNYAAALSVALRVAPVVKILDLRQNFITTKGAKELLETIIWQRKVCENWHEQICMICSESIIYDDPYGEQTRGCSCSQPSRGGKNYLHPVFVLESIKIRDTVTDFRKLKQSKVDFRRQSFEELKAEEVKGPFNAETMENLYWTRLKHSIDKLKSDFKGTMSLELRQNLAAKIFRDIDEDGSGVLNITEMKLALRKLGVNRFRAYVVAKRAIRKIDKSNTGTVNENDFIAFVANNGKPSVESSEVSEASDEQLKTMVNQNKINKKNIPDITTETNLPMTSDEDKTGVSEKKEMYKIPSEQSNSSKEISMGKNQDDINIDLKHDNKVQVPPSESHENIQKHAAVESTITDEDKGMIEKNFSSEKSVGEDNRMIHHKKTEDMHDSFPTNYSNVEHKESSGVSSQFSNLESLEEESKKSLGSKYGEGSTSFKEDKKEPSDRKEQEGIRNKFSILRYFRRKKKKRQPQNLFLKSQAELTEEQKLLTTSLRNFGELVFPEFQKEYYENAHSQTDKIVLDLKREIYLKMRSFFNARKCRTAKSLFEAHSNQFLNGPVKQTLDANIWTLLPEKTIEIDETLKCYSQEVVDYFFELHIQTVVMDVALGDKHTVVLNKADSLWTQGFHSTPGVFSLQDQVQLRILENIHLLEKQQVQSKPESDEQNQDMLVA